MTHKPQASVEMPKDTPQKVESSQEAAKQTSASNKWTAVQRIRVQQLRRSDRALNKAKRQVARVGRVSSRAGRSSLTRREAVRPIQTQRGREHVGRTKHAGRRWADAARYSIVAD
jgi:hypothetical protein